MLVPGASSSQVKKLTVSVQNPDTSSSHRISKDSNPTLHEVSAGNLSLLRDIYSSKRKANRELCTKTFRLLKPSRVRSQKTLFPLEHLITKSSLLYTCFSLPQCLFITLPGKLHTEEYANKHPFGPVHSLWASGPCCFTKRTHRRT
uniref:Testis cDNA, clone: QtsA-15234, similar to human protocadherin 8 (PCDH8), transcript variant 2 n=1 Tax=Macaca fascicularis TaxID=9541 RepID=Q4R7H8_MACFA|nr:unnamed protein product [Macaca fascicularis]